MNSYQFKIIIGLVFAFIFGVAVGGNHQPPAQEPSSLKAKEAKWQQLKTLDDEIFLEAGRGFALESSSMDACGRFDVATIKDNNIQLNQITVKVDQKIQERKVKLTELGY